MNAVSFAPELDADEDIPPTERAPASGLARLIASTRETPEDTLSRTPSIDLIALATGADDAAIGTMRALYASGDTDQALDVAASIRASMAPALTPSNDDGADPFGGLILVVDEELAVDDADIEEIDNAFLHFDL